MNKIKVYGKVLKLFWATAIAAELEYRLNFLIAVFSSLTNLTGSIFTLFYLSNQLYISGMELGRIFNCFRNVYPLTRNFCYIISA